MPKLLTETRCGIQDDGFLSLGPCSFLFFRKGVTKTQASKSRYKSINGGKEKALSHDEGPPRSAKESLAEPGQRDRSCREAELSEQEFEEKRNVCTASKYLHTNHL